MTRADSKDVKNLVDLGDGHWRIRVYVGRDARGKPQWASRNFRGTLKEARSARDAFKTDIQRQQVVTMHPITLGEMLDRWLDEIQGQRARSTMREYRRSVEKDIKPALGHIGLDKLTAQHLDRFYSGQLAKGLSPSTVHKFHAYLSAALTRAFKWELIARNPAVKASPPAAEKSRVRPPKVDAVKTMVVAAQETNPVLASALVIAAVTGARRGEICALRWSDIDWDDHVIVYEESLTFQAKETSLGPTKTHQHRKVAMDSILEAHLRHRRAGQEDYARTVGVRLVPDPYILSYAADGSLPAKPDSLSQAYRRLAARLGLTSHIHELRHFSATTAIASGMDVRTVAGRLGHADASTTLRIYADFVESRDRDLADILGRAVLGTEEAQQTGKGNVPAPAPIDHAE